MSTREGRANVGLRWPRRAFPGTSGVFCCAARAIVRRPIGVANERVFGEEAGWWWEYGCHGHVPRRDGRPSGGRKAAPHEDDKRIGPNDIG